MSSFAVASRLWKANLRVSPQGSLLQVSVPQSRRQSVRRTGDDVRFGSIADIPAPSFDVRFTSESRHLLTDESRHDGRHGRRPLYARPHRACRSEHRRGTWLCGQICQDGELSPCWTCPRQEELVPQARVGLMGHRWQVGAVNPQHRDISRMVTSNEPSREGLTARQRDGKVAFVR